MRFCYTCGSIDTVPSSLSSSSSYRKIRQESAENDPEELPQPQCSDSKKKKKKSVLKLGQGKSPSLSSSSPANSPGTPDSSSPRRRKVNIIDLLVGYQTLIQMSSSPMSLPKRELYPTIGFVNHPRDSSL